MRQKIKVSFLDTNKDELNGFLHILDEGNRDIAYLHVRGSLTFFVPQKVFSLSPHVDGYNQVRRDIKFDGGVRHYIYTCDEIISAYNPGSEAINEEALIISDRRVEVGSGQIIKFIPENIESIGEDLFYWYLDGVR